MTEAVSDIEAATESIARLSKLVFQYFESYRPAAERIVSQGNLACPDNAFLPQASGPLSDKTIILDAAYGGSEAGAAFSFPDGFTLLEKDVTLDVAFRLKDLLLEQGAMVYLTRCRDVSLSPMDRAAFANSMDADLFISIHLNGSDNPAKDGAEVDYFNRDGSVLANYLLGFYALPGLWDTLNASLSLPKQAVHQQDLDVLVFNRAPSAFTKSVFLTNLSEAAALQEPTDDDTSRRQEIARGHSLGILNYFKYFGDTD